MEKFSILKSRVIPLRINNIDTDQIIPARFLKVTDKNGLGSNLFSDWRYQKDGTPDPNFILNKEIYKNCQILLAGDNFGCGSSREHAPWALTGFGIKAVISTSFADIFRNNALKNGLLPVVVDQGFHMQLFDVLEEIPHAEIIIDLPAQKVTLPSGHGTNFMIDDFSKKCLVEGLDQLGYLISFNNIIYQYELQLET